jgi:PDZ domain
MKTRAHGKLASRALALVLGTWFLPGSLALSDDATVVANPKPQKWGKLHPKRTATSQGTLGYGPPGVYPGFQGFGLGYHLGYGYGGDALGVGAEGGYPLYGGPGYPHEAPCLRRLGSIEPFHYYGGLGGPWPAQPNFFDGVGALAPDQPVVTFANESPDGSNVADYGCFTGSIPYPESMFAPFATSIGETFSEKKAPTPPAPPSIVPDTTRLPDATRSLGLEIQPVTEAGPARGLKITRMQPGSAAERAGLQVGDVIRSANGYLTEQPGNLTWIFANAAPDRVLTFSVLAAKGGEARTVSVR